MQRGPAASAFASYAETLPVTAAAGDLSLCTLVLGVLQLVRANFTDNALAVPALQTIDVLRDADVLSKLNNVPEGQAACVLRQPMGIV